MSSQDYLKGNFFFSQVFELDLVNHSLNLGKFLRLSQLSFSLLSFSFIDLQGHLLEQLSAVVFFQMLLQVENRLVHKKFHSIHFTLQTMTISHLINSEIKIEKLLLILWNTSLICQIAHKHLHWFFMNPNSNDRLINIQTHLDKKNGRNKVHEKYFQYWKIGSRCKSVTYLFNSIAKKPNNPIEKWAKGAEQTFFQRRHTNGQQMDTKKCLVSLIIREMQIKTTIICYLRPGRMATVKKTSNKCW